MKLWGSRMSKSLDKEVELFSSSIAEDSQLYLYDLWGSAAHSRMLEKIGLLTSHEGHSLRQGLRAIKQEIEEGRIAFSGFEDIHSLIEARLRELQGEVGEKLHTARSRNDQIVLDEKLFLREEIVNIVERIHNLQKALLAKAQENLTLVMPGFTHLQPAQPVLFAHHLLAYFSMTKRDVARLMDNLERVNTLPLGAGALAGTSIPIDRFYVAKLLAFPSVQDNSMDVVSDRDFILEFLGNVALLFIHLSRMGEEIVLWSSPAFHFIEIDDSFTTGSSIMPQKKNPDVAELIRGKTGEVISSWISLATTLKGLPLTYNRDLQQDKPPLFRSIKEVKTSLRIAARLVENIRPIKEEMEKALRDGFLTATDFCEYLVTKGVPFRKAHQMVGELVKQLASRGASFRELTPSDLSPFSDFLDQDFIPYLEEKTSVERKASFGSSSPWEIERQLREATQWIAEQEEAINSLRKEWYESFERVLMRENAE